MKFRNNVYTIVLEGPDGVGKTTLASKLYTVIKQRIPGEFTVGIYKEPHRQGLETAEDYIRDRFRTVRMVNEDARNSMFHIAIIDRYNPSTRIYNRDSFTYSITARLLEIGVPVPNRIVILNHEPFTPEWSMWLDNVARTSKERSKMISVSIAYEYYPLFIRHSCSLRTVLIRPTTPGLVEEVYGIVEDDVVSRFASMLVGDA